MHFYILLLLLHSLLNNSNPKIILNLFSIQFSRNLDCNFCLFFAPYDLSLSTTNCRPNGIRFLYCSLFLAVSLFLFRTHTLRLFFVCKYLHKFACKQKYLRYE